MRTSILLLLLILLPLIAAPKTFYFTAIPDQDETQLVERFSQVATYLSETLGVPVKYLPVKSYAASVAAFQNGEVHLAWFGGLSGVQARRTTSGSVAIAQGAEDTAFVSYFIAHHSTKLTSGTTLSPDLKGKTFTFGSKGSTSGRLMPEYYLREAFKKSPQKLFKRVGFSGDHSQTIALVQSGAYQVGAVNYKVWERELAAGTIDTTKVSVIYKTPTYPDYNWTIRGDVEKTFGPNFITKVQEALIQMKAPALLAAFPRASFIAADNDLYTPIVTTGTAIGLFDE